MGSLCAWPALKKPAQAVDWRFVGNDWRATAVVMMRIGAAKPQAPCTQNCQGAVKVYGAMDEEAIFEVGGRFYKNKEVVVVVGSFEFRNPPSFVSLENPQERDIHVEVESLLDHLVFHENTAPFISYRLIQRLTSSNPTPAYVGAVAEAFRTGTYAGRTYQGVYGDLAATVAAILLHPEARSQTAETHGALREPLVKVVHFMRSMEYKDSAGRNVMLSNLMPVIGQFPYLSPSVFNFYLPDFKPSDFPEGKVGPEFEIFTPPLAIGFMNGLTSLIEHGLGPAHCETGGMGFAAPSNCSVGELHLGELECLQPTIDQMDLLLTGGRLHDSGKIKAAWQNSDGGHEYKTAQKFGCMGWRAEVGHSYAPPPPVVLEEPRSYKALVMIFMNGGADTFNMLVPMNCPLYDEYSEVRGSVALDPTDLNMISTTGQSCGNFGIHARLPILKELYDLEQEGGRDIETVEREKELNSTSGPSSAVAGAPKEPAFAEAALPAPAVPGKKAAPPGEAAADLRQRLQTANEAERELMFKEDGCFLFCYVV
eukprot:g17010.t1